MPSPTSPIPEPAPERPAVVHPPRVRRRTRARNRSTARPSMNQGPATTPKPSPPASIRPVKKQEADPGDGWEITDLIAAGLLDVVPGDPPVPVSVWRATGSQEPPTSPATLYRGLTPRLAARLLAIYTDPGQTVVDTTSDPAVAGAAGAGARRYLNLPLPPSRRMPDLSGQVALILLRWPSTGSRLRHDGDGEHPDTQPKLQACADLLHADGHTVVILAPPAGAAYHDHARTIIPAARQAGLGYLQHLVIITTPTDQPTPASQAEPAPAETPDSGPDAAFARTQAHLDLLVFILRHGTRS